MWLLTEDLTSAMKMFISVKILLLIIAIFEEKRVIGAYISGSGIIIIMQCIISIVLVYMNLDPILVIYTVI